MFCKIIASGPCSNKALNVVIETKTHTNGSRGRLQAPLIEPVVVTPWGYMCFNSIRNELNVVSLIITYKWPNRAFQRPVIGHLVVVIGP